MIRPIEAQGLIQRVQDISQINQNEANKPHIDQSNIQSHFQKELIHEHEHVIKKENADNNKKKFDAKEKGDGEYQGNKKKKKEKDSDGEVREKKKGGFDVKI